MVAGGNGMKRGGHANDGGGFFDTFPHGVLPLINVAVYLRERPVIPNGAYQYKGDLFFHAAVNNTVANAFLFDESRDGSVQPYPVYGVDMIVVTVGLGFLRVDILAKGCLAVSGLQVMGGQSVSSQQGIDITVLHQFGKSGSGIVVKSAGRA